jgi:hypothetical protein
MRWSSFFVLALCLPAIAAGPAGAGSVRGTVRDASTLAAIAGATVTVHVVKPDSIEIQAVSDVSGAYLVPDIPPGNEVYWLVCQKSGYALYYARLPDPGSSEVVFDILLGPEQPPDPGGDPDSSDVSGRILESGSLSPVPNATLTLRSGGTEYVAHTDGDGRYALSVGVGVYTVTVEAGGYESVTNSGIEAGAGGCTYDAVLEAAVVSVPAMGDGSGPIVLHGARPNPFFRTTAIRFSLSEPGHVELRVYDLLGREVRSLAAGWMDAGDHSIPFVADGLAPGRFFCRLKVGERVAAGAMTSLR